MQNETTQKLEVKTSKFPRCFSSVSIHLRADSIDPGERSRQFTLGKFLNLLKSFSISIHLVLWEANDVDGDGTEEKTLLSHGFHCHNFNFQTQEHFPQVHNLATNSDNAWAASSSIPG
jgi:hypothetical protein